LWSALLFSCHPAAGQFFLYVKEDPEASSTANTSTLLYGADSGNIKQMSVVTQP